MKTHDRYSEIQAFVYTAQHRGIGQAARALGVAPSVVSRRLTALERRLDSQLMERSTRQLRLTEIGEQYLLRVQQWVADLAEADAIVDEQQHRVSGVLRVALPSVFGRLQISPALPNLMRQFPDLRLEMVFSDRVEELISGHFDVAIRIGRLADSGLVARKLVENHRVLVAAPSYLAAHGSPIHPEQLQQHQCLHFAVRDGTSTWIFEKDQQRVEVPIVGRLRANHGEALFDAAIAGLGVTQLAQYIVGGALRDGRLVELLPSWRVPATGIYAVWPSTRFVAPKVRAFVDYFAEYFAEPMRVQF